MSDALQYLTAAVYAKYHIQQQTFRSKSRHSAKALLSRVVNGYLQTCYLADAVCAQSQRLTAADRQLDCHLHCHPIVVQGLESQK